MATKFRDVICDSRIVPDDCIAQRHAGAAIPKQLSFALIGDSYSGEICGTQRFLRHRRDDYFLSVSPNFLRIVLHPTRLRKNLAVFLLRKCNDLAQAIEDNKTSAGSSLIDSSNKISHGGIKLSHKFPEILRERPSACERSNALSGHDFSRAVSPAKSNRLQPLRAVSRIATPSLQSDQTLGARSHRCSFNCFSNAASSGPASLAAIFSRT